jgi:hypothetical protein
MHGTRMRHEDCKRRNIQDEADSETVRESGAFREQDPLRKETTTGTNYGARMLSQDVWNK